MTAMDPPGYTPSAPVVLESAVKRGKRPAPASSGPVSAAASNAGSSIALNIARDLKANELKIRKAWEVALAPAKSLPMQAFMLYMSGSGVQIFSMGIVWMLLTSPWSAVMQLLQVFEPYKQTVLVRAGAGAGASSGARTEGGPSTAVKRVINTELALPMVVYVLCQVLVLALGIYKCATMGLIPTGTGDWLAFETRGEPPEWSAVRLESMFG